MTEHYIVQSMSITSKPRQIKNPKVVGKRKVGLPRQNKMDPEMMETINNPMGRKKKVTRTASRDRGLQTRTPKSSHLSRNTALKNGP